MRCIQAVCVVLVLTVACASSISADPPQPPAAKVDEGPEPYYPGQGGVQRSASCVAVAPNGSIGAAGLSDGTIRVWSADGKEVQVLKGHTKSVTCLAISGNGKVLASGGEDGTVRLWDTEAGKELSKLTSDKKEPIVSLGISGDGKVVAGCPKDVVYYMWRQGSEKPVQVIPNPSYLTRVPTEPYRLIVSTDGTTVIAGLFIQEIGRVKLAAEDKTVRSQSGLVFRDYSDSVPEGVWAVE
jgi:hypothetical protein